MNLWDWEFLDQFQSGSSWQISNSNVLTTPILNFSIVRDQRLNLELTATSEHDGTMIGNTPRSAGTFVLTHPGWSTLEARQVFVRNCASTYDHRKKNGSKTETAYVQSIHTVENNNPAKETRYSIDWLENIGSDYYAWPDLVKSATLTKHTSTFGNGGLIAKSDSKQIHSGRLCVNFEVAGISIILGVAANTPDTTIDPGYILYRGDQSEADKAKIRDCVSLALGRPLIYLGQTKFSSDWLPVFVEMQSAYDFKGAAFETPSRPFTRLGTTKHKIIGKESIDGATFSHVVGSFYDHYDELDLEHFCWLYWHAVCAPTFVTPVHYAACIEAIIKSYTEHNGRAVDSRLFEKAQFSALRQRLLASLETFFQNPGHENEIEILKNKLNNLNDVPASLKSDRFFSAISLPLCSWEKSLWQSRNSAAHGRKISSDSIEDFVRRTNALQTLIHRIVVKTTGAANAYYDYHHGYDTLHDAPPLRNIGESIGP